MYDFKADTATLTEHNPGPPPGPVSPGPRNTSGQKFRITQNMADDDCFIFADDDIHGAPEPYCAEKPRCCQ